MAVAAYLTFAPEDREAGETVRGWLEAGLAGIAGGQALSATLSEATMQSIGAARALVVLLSPGAQSSEAVQKEVLYALGNGRQIVPVLLASLTGASRVAPEQLRRNLLVSGINLLALVKLRFAIGEEVVLVGTGPCAPCQKLGDTLGPGGFQAARGHGGITARIERGGTIRLGDSVRVLPSEPDLQSS